MDEKNGVTRFAKDMDGSMVPFDEGQWVLYEDYDNLRRTADEVFDELRAKLALAEQDARRYRWLRSGLSLSSRQTDHPRDVLLNGDWIEDADELDAAIDASWETSA